MTDIGWFTAFTTIFVLMIAVSLAMAWYSRRALKEHKDQIEDIIREMREVIDDQEGDPPAAE